MLRTGNKKVALATLLLDAAKGAVAVMYCIVPFNSFDPFYYAYKDHGVDVFPILAALAVLAASVGHMYSPWLKFKGGKGVATLFGGAMAFSWPVGMAAFFVWLIVMFVTRYVSLASIVALAAAPLITWLRVDGTSALIVGIAAGIAIWKHRENIKRLRKGFEPKLSLGKGEKP